MARVLFGLRSWNVLNNGLTISRLVYNGWNSFVIPWASNVKWTWKYVFTNARCDSLAHENNQADYVAGDSHSVTLVYLRRLFYQTAFYVLIHAIVNGNVPTANEYLQVLQKMEHYINMSCGPSCKPFRAKPFAGRFPSMLLFVMVILVVWQNAESAFGRAIATLDPRPGLYSPVWGLGYHFERASLTCSKKNRHVLFAPASLMKPSLAS